MLRTSSILTRLTSDVLAPDLFKDFDAKTLMVGIAAGEMTVGEQLARAVTAGELKFFPVAHGGLFLGWWILGLLVE